MLATPSISLVRKSAIRTNARCVPSSVSSRSDPSAHRIIATQSNRTVGKQQGDLHYLRCPNCGTESTTKVCKNTVLLNYPFSCPHCQARVFINYVETTAVVIDKKVIHR